MQADLLHPGYVLPVGNVQAAHALHVKQALPVALGYESRSVAFRS